MGAVGLLGLGRCGFVGSNLLVAADAGSTTEHDRMFMLLLPHSVQLQQLVGSDAFSASLGGLFWCFYNPQNS